jgi:hypothetical protein
MMGLEVLGAVLLALAMSLMTVCPLHLTIARAKARPLPISAALHRVDDTQPEAPDLDRLIREADDALARDPLISATASLADTYRNT